MDKLGNLLREARIEANQLYADSSKLSTLKDFTKMYIGWQEKARDIVSIEELKPTLEKLSNIIDNIIVKKLDRYDNNILDHVDCIGKTRDIINNKYIRYRIFDYCYSIKGEEIFRTGNTVLNNREFVEFMRYTYLKFKGLFRGFSNTDNPPMKQKKQDRLVNLIKASSK